MAVNTLPSPGRTQQAGASATHCPEERRKRVRTSVHWPVTLFRAASRAVLESTTKDLSSDGLYCIANAKLTVGERVVLLLLAPAHDPTGKEPACAFRCDGRVVRVEPTSVDGMFGVACHIEDYALWRTCDYAAAFTAGRMEPAS